MNSRLSVWLEAARLHTLPVSASSVVVATALAYYYNTLQWIPATACLLFAILAQVASNFANDYFDFIKGSDTPDRVGHRRAVSSGDISARTMLKATLLTLILACMVGCTLIVYGGWWLIAVGIVVALFALAYSPLAYLGLGDVAVLVFFGMVPVNLTYYVQSGTFDWTVFAMSIAVGLLAMNVLLVNNYRDVEQDKAANKRTTVVIFGKSFAKIGYLLGGLVAIVIPIHFWLGIKGGIAAPIFLLVMHISTWYAMCKKSGSELNSVLGKTALNLLQFAILLTFCIYLSR